MRKLFFQFSYLIFFTLFYKAFSIERREITFKSTTPIPSVQINKKDLFVVKADFTKGGFLYIYPRFVTQQNLGVFKIFFKKYIKDDEDANIFNSDYYTIEVNSGLFIDSNKLDYETANVFIEGYGSMNFYMSFAIVDKIRFPSSTLINQFSLKKDEKVEIDYSIEDTKNDAITILSKYSLRNVNIKVLTDSNEDITFVNGGYFYPNGYSFFFDRKQYTANYKIIMENNKKISKRDEVIILGLTKYQEENSFPYSVINGMQLYIERVNYVLWYLKNTLTSNFYYTYQIYEKNALINYLDSEGYTIGTNTIQEYNSMVYNSIQTSQMSIQFSTLYAGLYIQFLDFSDLETVQKNLQPLVSGLKLVKYFQVIAIFPKN